MLKYLFVFIGIISLGLGILGIFLPLLPTTPFLLLSTILFARSSKKLHNWLINHKVFGNYIRNFIEEKSIPLKVKISSTLLLWFTILFSIFFVIEDKTWLQILLFAIAIGVTIHILHYKTKR
ncbi:MAG: YbaN family protein [Bacteroidetes bacterium]|nr:YbaN family protein [Bacteroidota bacterium]